MFELEDLTKRALASAWPFVAGRMAAVREALSPGADGTVPRAVYFASLRTLRALESLVRRMLYLMSLELAVQWVAPRPRAAGLLGPGPAGEASGIPVGDSPPRKLALADPLSLYIPPPDPPVKYGPRPYITIIGMPRAPEPEGPPDWVEAAPLLTRLSRLVETCAARDKEAGRMARWQARRLALMKAGQRGRSHPLRTGRPPGYATARARRDDLQKKLKDFWCFCHWADEAAYASARAADGASAPA